MRAQQQGRKNLTFDEDRELRGYTDTIKGLGSRIRETRSELDRMGSLPQLGRGERENRINTAGMLCPLSFDMEEMRSAHQRVGRGEAVQLESRNPGFSSADSLLPPQLFPIPTMPRFEDRLIDRLPGFALDAPSLEYIQVTSVTGAAAIVGEGQPKPGIETPATKLIVTALKLAAHVGISWESINDFEAFTSAVQNTLLKEIVKLENTQIVYGDPTAGGLNGLTTTAGILTLAATGGTATPANNWDDVAGAIALLRTGPALASPDLLCVHPDTWTNIRTQKDSLGRYLATPAPTDQTAETMWDVDVLQSTQINPGDGILLDTSLFGRVAVRETLVMRMGYGVIGGQSDWISNVVRWLAEERLNVAVERPAAICWITGLPTAAPTLATSRSEK
jgi:hypothetical protein